MMRLSGKLTPDLFEVLLREYQRLLRRLFEEMGGREVVVSGDSALAAFPTAKEAGLAAVTAQRSVATHEWPLELTPAISVGLHSGQAGIGSADSAAARALSSATPPKVDRSSCRRRRRSCSRTRISASSRFAIWVSSRRGGLIVPCAPTSSWSRGARRRLRGRRTTRALSLRMPNVFVWRSPDARGRDAPPARRPDASALPSQVFRLLPRPMCELQAHVQERSARTCECTFQHRCERGTPVL